MVIDSRDYEGRSQDRNDKAFQDSWKNRGRHGLVTEPPTCGRLQNLRKVSHGHLEQPYDEAVPRTFPLHATISVGGVSLLFIKTSGS